MKLQKGLAMPAHELRLLQVYAVRCVQLHVRVGLSFGREVCYIWQVAARAPMSVLAVISSLDFQGRWRLCMWS